MELKTAAAIESVRNIKDLYIKKQWHALPEALTWDQAEPGAVQVINMHNHKGKHRMASLSLLTRLGWVFFYIFYFFIKLKPGSEFTSSRFSTWRSNFLERKKSSKSKVHPTHLLRPRLWFQYTVKIFILQDIQRRVLAVLTTSLLPPDSRAQVVFFFFSCQHHYKKSKHQEEKWYTSRANHFTFRSKDVHEKKLLIPEDPDTPDQMTGYSNSKQS